MRLVMAELLIHEQTELQVPLVLGHMHELWQALDNLERHILAHRHERVRLDLVADATRVQRIVIGRRLSDDQLVLAAVLVEQLVLGVAVVDRLLVVLDVPQGARLEAVDDALEDTVVAFDDFGERLQLFDKRQLIGRLGSLRRLIVIT